MSEKLEKLLAEAETVDIFKDLSPEKKARSAMRASIAAALIKKRCELGMNQVDFATFLGVSQTEVSKWENGARNFSIDRLAEIFLKLGIVMDITPSKYHSMSVVVEKTSTPSCGEPMSIMCGLKPAYSAIGAGGV